MIISLYVFPSVVYLVFLSTSIASCYLDTPLCGDRHHTFLSLLLVQLVLDSFLGYVNLDSYPLRIASF